VAPELVLRVDDLVGHPEKSRPLKGEVSVSLRLGESSMVGLMAVAGRVLGTVDGVQASFTAVGDADLTCSRCLTEWVESVTVDGSQHFSRVPDEDGYAIVGGEIDIAGPATDEMALALPAAPLCRPDCLGLCPTCGTDLNTDPCDGHGDDSDSPFAALKDLFDP
jgi:uncharacterized protein